MAALTASREADRKDGVIMSHPVAATEMLYKGSTAILDATTRNAKTNDGTTTTLTAGDIFAGIVVETVDNSGGLAGAKSVRLYRKGIFLLPFVVGDSVAKTHVGSTVYLNDVGDDGAVTITKDAVALHVNIVVGQIAAIGEEANTAYVMIDNAIGNLGVANAA